MVLAEQNLIPNAFATVVRAAVVARAIVAIEEGAKGPSKDCAYENPFLKCITGTPVSSEGKTAACAHLSAVGNIAMSCADLWSNESVQNIMLLGSTAPVAYMESLIYDCRLFNEAAKNGEALKLRQWMVDGDAPLDNRAYLFRPENIVALSKEFVTGANHYDACKKIVMATAKLLIEAGKTNATKITKMENKYLEKIVNTVNNLPAAEGEFINKMMAKVDKSKFDPKGYGL